MLAAIPSYSVALIKSNKKATVPLSININVSLVNLIVYLRILQKLHSMQCMALLRERNIDCEKFVVSH
jgi:hypothetical protein